MPLSVAEASGGVPAKAVTVLRGSVKVMEILWIVSAESQLVFEVKLLHHLLLAKDYLLLLEHLELCFPLDVEEAGGNQQNEWESLWHLQCLSWSS